MECISASMLSNGMKNTLMMYVCYVIIFVLNNYMYKYVLIFSLYFHFVEYAIIFAMINMIKQCLFFLKMLVS